MDAEFMTVSEAAKHLKVSRQRILQRIASGSLKAQKIGTFWVIEKKSLDVPPHVSELSTPES